MRISVTIYDREPGFAKNLARGLSKIMDPVYELLTPDSETQLLESLLGSHYLIINHRDLKEDIRNALKKESSGSLKPRLILMTDKEGYRDPEGHPVIYKYQPLRSFLKSFSEAKETDPFNGSLVSEEPLKARVFGVAGAVGRCGKTSFSLTLGLGLSETGRTLFVNFDPCSSLKAMLKDVLPDDARDMSDLLYDFHHNREETVFSDFIHTCGGLDILCPVHLQEDLYETDPVSYADLLNNMVKICGYDALVLDLGQNLALIKAFLPFMDRLYIPVLSDELSREKTALLREWIDQTDEGIKKPVREEIRLPEPCPFLSGRNYPSQLLWGEMGKMVKELLIDGYGSENTGISI